MYQIFVLTWQHTDLKASAPLVRHFNNKKRSCAVKEPASLCSATLCVRHSVATSLLFGGTYSLSWRAAVRGAGGSHQALPLAWCWHWSGVEGTEIWQHCHKNQSLQTPGKETYFPPNTHTHTHTHTHKHKVKKSSRSECTHAATACQHRSGVTRLHM